MLYFWQKNMEQMLKLLQLQRGYMILRPSLFYLAYVNRGLSMEEGMKFVKNKLCRSYSKLSERSKKTSVCETNEYIRRK